MNNPRYAIMLQGQTTILPQNLIIINHSVPENVYLYVIIKKKLESTKNVNKFLSIELHSIFIFLP